MPTLDTSNHFELFLFCVLLAVTLTTVFQLTGLGIRWYGGLISTYIERRRHREDYLSGRIEYDEYLQRALPTPEAREIQRARDNLLIAELKADEVARKRKAAQKRK